MALILDLRSQPTKAELIECVDVMLASVPIMVQSLERGHNPQVFNPEFVARQSRVFRYIKANMHKLTDGMP